MFPELEQPLREIARELSVIAGDRNSAWNAVVLDTRFDDAGGFLTKIRCDVPDSSKTVSLSSSSTINLALIDLDSKRSLTGEPWFGLMVRVSSDGKSTIDFNYDRECDEDQSFFDD